MFYDATGKPEDDGDFELKDGSLILRPGKSLSFNRFMMDSPRSSGAKDDAPGSIDEALQQAFAAAAERNGLNVSEWLGKVEPKELDALIAEVATAFVRAHAGQGIAKQFSQDSNMLTDAERDYAVAKARAEHNLRNGHRGADAPVFTADAAATAVADAIGMKVHDRARQMVHAADQNSDSRLRSEAEGARAARKHTISNAWRG